MVRRVSIPAISRVNYPPGARGVGYVELTTGNTGYQVPNTRRVVSAIRARDRHWQTDYTRECAGIIGNGATKLLHTDSWPTCGSPF